VRVTKSAQFQPPDTKKKSFGAQADRQTIVVHFEAETVHFLLLAE